MDVSELGSGSSHVAEKLYLLHRQPGRAVQETVSASFHRRLNGVKTRRRASALISLVAMHVPNTCALVQTGRYKKTSHMELSLSQD